MKRLRAYIFCAVLFCTSLRADDIDGFWKNLNEKTGKPGILVSIYEYQGKRFGRIIGSYDKNGVLDDTIYAAVGRAPGVEGNPFYSGIDFIWNLTKKGAKYRGKIMDPRKGRTFDVELWVEEGNLIVRGELFFFGKNEVWHPATQDDFTPFFKIPDTTSFVPVIPQKVKR